MKRALVLTLNEVKLYLQDKGDLAFGLLLPIVTFALLYGAFGGDTAFTGISRIVDEDGGVYAQQLIDAVDSADGVSVSLLTREDAESKLDRSDITFALFIPAGFSAALEAGVKIPGWYSSSGATAVLKARYLPVSFAAPSPAWNRK
jgi:hypothetical protein